jgi:hypothetical protein
VTSASAVCKSLSDDLSFRIRVRAVNGCSWLRHELSDFEGTFAVEADILSNGEEITRFLT